MRAGLRGNASIISEQAPSNDQPPVIDLISSRTHQHGLAALARNRATRRAGIDVDSSFM
jgi:hypothetical protein